ncbi:Hypothetical Protein FCC1311_080722 [Hondaea fermentalgiana]|uniref:Uncharacterized protein n=1 Tax=Hondaea fermentalgiana TaxID=2315210 RepID=A0A2R5GLU0_9STRA|nr:Hypothetical Protein FCC1311_080722 [Hondaea fermentalgiana]|eukprot:GBG31847.1 Hypothetical Protein FCC1311_080722 [Hondaea fermentalgiana]
MSASQRRDGYRISAKYGSDATDLLENFERSVCSPSNGEHRKHLYGLKFSTRTFVEQLISEFAYSILGIASVPLQVALQGTHGSISQGFIPGRFGSGQWNLPNYIFQLILTLMVQFILLCILMDKFVFSNIANSQKGDRFADLFYPTFDVSYVLVLYSARNVLVAIKYSFVDREKFIEIRRHGRTFTSFIGEMIIAFALRPARYMLYNQLEVSFVQHSGTQAVKSFAMDRDLDKTMVRDLNDQLTRGRLLHACTIRAANSNKLDAEDHTASSATVTPIDDLKNFKTKMSVLTDSHKVSCKETARESEYDCRRVSVRALLFDHIIRVYRGAHAGFSTFGMGLKGAIFLMLCLECLSAYSRLQKRERTYWWHLPACLCVGILRTILVTNINFFMLAAQRHFTRVKMLLEAHRSMLIGHTNYCREQDMDDAPRLEVLHVPNLHAWFHSFAIMREFGFVFTVRFNACVLLFLMCTTLQLFVALIELMFSTDAVGWEYYMPCFFATSLLVVSVLRTLLCASRVNRLHLIDYPRMLLSLQARVREHQWCMRASVDGETTGLVPAELRRLFKRLGSRERVSAYLDLVVDTLRLADTKIASVPPISMLGQTITTRVIKSAVLAAGTTTVILWKATTSNMSL